MRIKRFNMKKNLKRKKQIMGMLKRILSIVLNKAQSCLKKAWKIKFAESTNKSWKYRKISLNNYKPTSEPLINLSASLWKILLYNILCFSLFIHWESEFIIKLIRMRIFLNFELYNKQVKTKTSTSLKQNGTDDSRLQ